MRQETSAFLRVIHLNKQVPSGDSVIHILNDVNLNVITGESVAILGASGSGKTTLLTLLAGLDLPSSGEIYFQEQHLNLLDEDKRAQIRRESVGFIFQSFQLLPSLNAVENVMLPLEIQYVAHQECKSRAVEWLNRVGLGNRLYHYPAQLSGGEQQRVAIARAFVNHPQILFADEMTGNLDTHTGQLITDIVFELNREQGTTLLLVTHDTILADRCDRRLFLHEGVLQPC
ncbi:Lipoprotein-releasing system ATP-binding protein LolD [Aquicella siphonis]|uniref:Lipoprotein-releasing system ATP-binding protein LolD n=1 Tax=Aquicella siphonis TaxID=254247 RepID=A0A5E4PJK0_9COXI|nr:ATP-binding cassette domain-containing protein [Aquicella siphonis]VVC77144.1 Lipoprotein-releasing system ATP-binding protein LolD [Aquicella siphonis]